MRPAPARETARLAKLYYMRSFANVFFLTLLSLTLWGCGTPAATVSLEDNVVLIQDGEGDAEVRFKAGSEKDYVVYVCQYAESDGSIEHMGSYRSLSYLTSSGYREFQTKYGGDRASCPASFLNSQTHSARLIGADATTNAKLKELEFSGKYGIEFRFKGRFLTFVSGKARDGSDWNINFGGTKTFLVTKMK